MTSSTREIRTDKHLAVGNDLCVVPQRPHNLTYETVSSLLINQLQGVRGR